VSRASLFVVAAAALSSAMLGVFWKRDLEQQRKLEALNARVTELVDAVRSSQASPAGARRAEGRSSLEPRDVERIAQAVAAASHAAAGSAAAAIEPEPIATARMPSPTRSPSTPEQQVAVFRASDRLDEALRRRTLTSDDITAIRTELAMSPPEAAEQLRAKIARAINRKELVPEEHPFTIP
jgi:hypothetical protein